jgi:hypothetical protein
MSFLRASQSIPPIWWTPLSSAYLLSLRTVGSVGWHHLARCPSWRLHAVGSLGVHDSLSSVLCCKSIGRCHLFGTCGIGGATSCCACFRPAMKSVGMVSVRNVSLASKDEDKLLATSSFYSMSPILTILIWFLAKICPHEMNTYHTPIPVWSVIRHPRRLDHFLRSASPRILVFADK